MKDKIVQLIREGGEAEEIADKIIALLKKPTISPWFNSPERWAMERSGKRYPR